MYVPSTDGPLCYTFFMWHSACVALFSCCLLFMLYYFHVALSSLYSLFILNVFMLHYFHFALFSCCFFYTLHYFHAAFFVLHSFQVPLFSCCILFILQFFHVALFFILHYFPHGFIPGALFSCCPFFRVTLCSYCTIFMLFFFFLAALCLCCTLFILQFSSDVIFSCSTF